MSDIESTTGKVAGAVTSVAQALEKPIATASDIVKALLLPPSQGMGDLMGDWFWRRIVTNRVRFAKKLQALLEERDLEERVVPPMFLLKAAQHAAVTEEEDLQALWAELVAQGIEHEDRRHPMYVDALSRMTSADATLFAEIAAQPTMRKRFPRSAGNPPALGPLKALGLVETIHEELLTYEEEVLIGEDDEDARGRARRLGLGRPIALTELGAQFAVAVGLRAEALLPTDFDDLADRILVAALEGLDTEDAVYISPILGPERFDVMVCRLRIPGVEALAASQRIKAFEAAGYLAKLGPDQYELTDAGVHLARARMTARGNSSPSGTANGS